MATGDRRQGDLKSIPYDYYWQRGFSLAAHAVNSFPDQSGVFYAF